MVDVSGADVLATNAVIAGKFRVLRKLGEGGMGMVYEAESVALGQRVAVKIISQSAQDPRSDEVVQRFHREARVMAQLENDNVVRVLDYGTLPDGSPYIAMEFLRGIDLSEYLQKHGPMSVPEAAEIGAAACNALAEAHTKGIVHRDLKPANLFLVERPGGRHVVKLLDFGISLFREAGVDPITATRAGIGTPLYAAPELFVSPRTADGRVDIWSLGATIYELVTGSVPFPAQTLSELALKLRSPPPRASAVHRDVPEEFADVLAACLQRDPAKRMPSISALGTAFQRFRLLNQSSLLFGGRMDDNLRQAFALTETAPPVAAPAPQPNFSGATPKMHLAKTAIDPTRQARSAPTEVMRRPASRRWWLWLVPIGFVIAAAAGAFAYFERPLERNVAGAVGAHPSTSGRAARGADVPPTTLSPLRAAPQGNSAQPNRPRPNGSKAQPDPTGPHDPFY